MDWFIGAIPPPEYQAVAWFANVATIIETIGWAINYACILGQLAAAATLGPGVAATVVACFCYLLLTVGSLCQLIIRGSSRGTSYTMWASRFIGNLAAGFNAHFRVTYWPQVFGFLDTALMKWFVATTTIVELCYIFVLRHIRDKEAASHNTTNLADKKR
ncbi:hypothetical protein PENARI_c010G02081 [Penicillium arizonense]|uniref:Uncharacterized protein n=1 Tax=Penicillium arizonense TaxID=1835702 RepID=A0A1F5LGK6_PENAI|nr:hypothetical protein PENARI_c010G02081 [Penicillium arizonense]OGE52342.1 hypothetical protein PENARI_c010G02081 [Penicillium arizonense]